MRVTQLLVPLYRTYRRRTSFRRGRGLFERLAQLGLERPRFTTADGFRIELGVDHVTMSIFEDGAWEPEATGLLASVTPEGGVFVDVGANIGYFSVLASRWVGPQGTVYAFEPVARTYERLLTNLRLNAASNVLPFALACSSAPGTGRFASDSDPGYAHLSASGDGQEEVVVTTIDAFAVEQSLSRLDVMKIDVEGADLEVIRGARVTIERFRPVILMETEHLSRFRGNELEVKQLLEPIGYECTPRVHRSARDLCAVPRNLREP